MIACARCKQEFEVPILHACRRKVVITEEQLDNLEKIWENGCPTYDPSEYNDSGYDHCWFCDAWLNAMPGDGDNKHRDGCPWLTLEEIFAHQA